MGSETFRSIVSKESAQITVTRRRQAPGHRPSIHRSSARHLRGSLRHQDRLHRGGGATPSPARAIAATAFCTPSCGLALRGRALPGCRDAVQLGLRQPCELCAGPQPETVASAADGGAEVPLIARVSHSAWPDRTVAATFADPSAAVEVFAPEGNVSQEIVAEELTGSVAAGGCRGRRQLLPGQRTCRPQDLIACEDFAGPPVFSRASASEVEPAVGQRRPGADRGRQRDAPHLQQVILSRGSSVRCGHRRRRLRRRSRRRCPKRRARAPQTPPTRRRWAMSERCPVCSHEISPNDTVCPTCGFKLLGATQAMQPLVMSETAGQP